MKRRASGAKPPASDPGPAVPAAPFPEQEPEDPVFRSRRRCCSAGPRPAADRSASKFQPARWRQVANGINGFGRTGHGSQMGKWCSAGAQAPGLHQQCSFWRSQNDLRDASRAEIAVHRQVVEPGSSTRTTQSDNRRSRPGACRGPQPAMQVGWVGTSGALCRAWLSPAERENPAIHQPVNAIGQVAGATSTTCSEWTASVLVRPQPSWP